MFTGATTSSLTNAEEHVLHDGFGRTIDYLRISLTDRCNLRCVYCMPEEGVPSLLHEDILTLEEVISVVELAAKNGIKHIRLTGGEPLVRKGIVGLVQAIKQIKGIESVALTTNGILLPTMANDLKNAGLDRVNISLDSLDKDQYRAITRCGTLADALAGIDAALHYEFAPVKINVVVVRHLNQNLAQFARLTLDKPLHVRFIEYMPIGKIDDSLPPAINANPLTKTVTSSAFIPWSDHDVVPAVEIRSLLNDALKQEGIDPLVPLKKCSTDARCSSKTAAKAAEYETPDTAAAPVGWGPASYYKIPGAKGTIGFISAISNHFCATCNRLRLTADGKLRPCLFSDEELDIRGALRNGTEKDLQQIFNEALRIKPAGHHHRRGTERSMSQVGG